MVRVPMSGPQLNPQGIVFTNDAVGPRTWENRGPIYTVNERWIVGGVTYGPIKIFTRRPNCPVGRSTNWSMATDVPRSARDPSRCAQLYIYVRKDNDWLLWTSEQGGPWMDEFIATVGYLGGHNPTALRRYALRIRGQIAPLAVADAAQTAAGARKAAEDKVSDPDTSTGDGGLGALPDIPWLLVAGVGAGVLFLYMKR